MSDKFVPYHLRDIHNPPAHLDATQKSNWIRTAQKAKKNYQHQQQYPAFNLPTSSYEVVYVNKSTTSEALQKLIDHVRHCHEFSFDTEGDRSSKQLALIQIQTIPRQLPCFVILFELLHLPLHDTLIFVKIRQLFHLIFQSNNKLYSWGPLRVELSPAVNYELFEWPIKSQIFDIQRDFSKWYTWALSHCEVCSPSLIQHNVIHEVRLNTNINSCSKCTCHEASPYGPGEKWGLQDALIYTCQLFIDKSMTVSSWAKSLDPLHSTLSTTVRAKMLHYAIYDCFTTTYLARPVLAFWTFQQVKNTHILDLFQASTSPSSTSSLSSSHHDNNDIINTNINPQFFKNVIDNDLEFISEDSDDDIAINQCRTMPVNNALYEQISDDEIDFNHLVKPNEFGCAPVNNDALNNNEFVVNNHYMVDDVNKKEEKTTTKTKTPRKHQHRSLQARHRRNHQRNTILKKYRYHYSIKRKWYPRFTMFMVRQILRLYRVNYKHVRNDGDELLIGLKDRLSRDRAHHQLPWSIFNRHSYFYYRDVFRR